MFMYKRLYILDSKIFLKLRPVDIQAFFLQSACDILSRLYKICINVHIMNYAILQRRVVNQKYSTTLHLAMQKSTFFIQLD